MEGREPTAKVVADQIIAVFDHASCRELDECIIDAIRSLGRSLSELQVMELTEELVSPVRTRINSYIEASNAKGVPPKMSWSSESTTRLIGRSFVRPSDPPEIRKLKLSLTTIDEIQKALSDLPSKKFEILCCGLLLDMGCRDVGLVRKRTQLGIDLFGIFQLTEPQAVRGAIFRIVAQAKCYSDIMIPPELLLNFWGSINLAADDPDKLADILPPQMLDKRHPVSGIFFTSSTFTPEAIRLARKFREKLRLMDGEQIAYKIMPRTVSETDGTIAFSLNKLLSYIHVLETKIL